MKRVLPAALMALTLFLACPLAAKAQTPAPQPFDFQLAYDTSTKDPLALGTYRLGSIQGVRGLDVIGFGGATVSDHSKLVGGGALSWSGTWHELHPTIGVGLAIGDVRPHLVLLLGIRGQLGQ